MPTESLHSTSRKAELARAPGVSQTQSHKLTPPGPTAPWALKKKGQSRGQRSPLCCDCSRLERGPRNAGIPAPPRPPLREEAGLASEQQVWPKDSDLSNRPGR